MIVKRFDQSTDLIGFGPRLACGREATAHMDNHGIGAMNLHNIHIEFDYLVNNSSRCLYQLILEIVCPLNHSVVHSI